MSIEDYTKYLPTEAFVTNDGEPIICHEISILSSQLRWGFSEAYKRAPQIFNSLAILADDNILCLHLRASPHDQIAVVNSVTNKAELLFFDDKVSYESCSPLQLVQYCFEGCTYRLYFRFFSYI